MDENELNLRAVIFMFLDGHVSQNIAGFNPLHNGDDCMRLLIAGGFSLQHVEGEIIAECVAGEQRELTRDGDLLATARSAVTTLAAGMVLDEDVVKYKAMNVA
ncbi:hypothetical protein [Cupriavidus basilensis]